jgi:hypothetical protein
MSKFGTSLEFETEKNIALNSVVTINVSVQSRIYIREPIFYKSPFRFAKSIFRLMKKPIVRGTFDFLYVHFDSHNCSIYGYLSTYPGYHTCIVLEEKGQIFLCTTLIHTMLAIPLCM